MQKKAPIIIVKGIGVYRPVPYLHKGHKTYHEYLGFIGASGKFNVAAIGGLAAAELRALADRLDRFNEIKPE